MTPEEQMLQEIIMQSMNQQNNGKKSTKSQKPAQSN